MTSKFKSNMSRAFSNSGFSRSYSTGPKPFHFTKLNQANANPLPTPSTYKPKKEKRSSGLAAFCCCCCTALCSILLTVILGLGIAALVIWLVLRPVHLPQYTLHDVKINTLQYNSSPHTLDANFAYTIVADNPNGKIGLKYDIISIETSYMGQVFGRSSIPGFYHGHRNITTVTTGFNVTSFTLTPSSGTMLAGEVAAGNLPFLVRVNVKGRLKIGILTTPAVWVHVNCDVNIKPPTTNAAASLISKSCKRV